MAQEVQEARHGPGLDPELYAVFAVLEAARLDAAAARLLERTLRDFRRSGVDRDEATRARLRELSEKGLLLSQDFSKNIRERPLDPSAPTSSTACRRTGSTPTRSATTASSP